MQRKPFAQPKIFYGYIIISASTSILVIMHGISSTYGVFFNSMQSSLSADRTAIAGASSLSFLLGGIFSLPIGKLTDKFGPKIVMGASGLLFGTGFFLMSRITSMVQLYLFYALIIGISGSSGNVTLLSTAAKWFTKRRGLMTSIVKVGTGAGMFIGPLAASWLILSYGWRNAYLILGIVSFITIFALAQLLRSDPAQMSLHPYGKYDANGTLTESVEGIQLSLRDAMRTRQFWVICAAYFMAWYATQSIWIHIVAYATDGGIAATQAAVIVSIIGLVSIVGRLVMGAAGDRLGNKRALIICFILLAVALSSLQLAKGLSMLYLFAIIYGFAHGGLFAIMSPLVAEFFGTKSHGTILGMTLFLSQTGGALGPVVTARIFDLSHSYQLAFIILLAVSIGALIMSTLFIKPVNIRHQKQPNGYPTT